MLTLHSAAEIGHQVRQQKFTNVPASVFSLSGGFDDFVRLSKSWEDMPPDPHFGQTDAGRRFRRYSDFEYHPADRTLRQLEHRPYFQSKANNRYVGGLERHFGDFGAEVLDSPVLRSLIDIDFEVYKSTLDPKLHDQAWQCQIHQIRIEIHPGRELEITPEGIHSDGYPFSGVHFWGKANVAGAESRLYFEGDKPVAAATYERILDTTYFLDREMLHYVTPARTLDPSVSAFRQIIAISFSKPGTEHDIVP